MANAHLGENSSKINTTGERQRLLDETQALYEAGEKLAVCGVPLQITDMRVCQLARRWGWQRHTESANPAGLELLRKRWATKLPALKEALRADLAR